MPNIWEVKAFGQRYAEPSRNGIYKSADFQGRGHRIVNMGEMFGYEFISDQEMSRISMTPKEMLTFGLRDGDLLFGRRSVVPAGAGKCSIVVEPSEPLTFESSIIRVRLNQAVANPHFHYYFFGSPIGRGLMRNIVAGTNVKGIRSSELKELQIPCPTLQEQEAIATVLRNMDQLLSNLDRLIIKKRNLKNAAMQQLLTGQTRLPGFSEEWVAKELGDAIQEISDGGTPSTLEKNNFGGFIPWIVIDDIKPKIFNTKTTLTEKGLHSCTSKIWPKGTLIVSTGATIGEVGILQVKAATKQGICGIVFDPIVVSTKFMYFWFLQNKQLLLSKAQGSSIKEVRAPTLRKLPLLVPNLNEQLAVVEILEAMENELETLEQRRTKTAALKQGMMQELLTGRARLL